MTGVRSALRCPSDAQLRARTGLKWSRTPSGEIPCDIAELDFDVAEPVLDVVRSAVDRSDFGYPDYETGTPVRLAEIFAERTHRRYGWRPDPARVEICAQIVQGLCCALLAYTELGDAVLVHEPTYPPFVEAIVGLGRRCVPIPVADLRTADELAQAVAGQAPSLLVICQPHNPTGHVFDHRTLEVFGEYADRHDAVVFCDEIHQDLVHSPHRHVGAGAVAALAGRAVCFTSAAKSFNIPGLRCAVGHFGAGRLHDAFRRLPWHLRSGASITGIAATAAAWESGADWQADLDRQLLRNLDLLETLRGHFSWRRPMATYLAWIHAPEFAGMDRISALGVTVRCSPGNLFGLAYGDYVRLNFGTSPARLTIIIDTLIAALTTPDRMTS